MTSPDRQVLQRVDEILARLSTEQKVAQLVGLWAGADPRDGYALAFVSYDGMDRPESFEAAARYGLGRIDRPYGTRPIRPQLAALNVRRLQQWLADQPPHIPALIQEEMVSGLMTYGATAFPAPLAWGATFDPEIVEEMGAAVGRTARQAGVLLGFGPVLDVAVDTRWGRTEECIAEDPYLVGVLGSAWICGIQSQRVIATAKHFVGHSASHGARNQAPASVGARELADVHLVPFEMACRVADVGAVMLSYVPLDGVFPVADRHLVTTVLRERVGFTGFVIADLLAVTALYHRNGIARDAADAGAMALRAGVDMELTNGSCFPAAVAGGAISEEILDAAVRRVLRAKLAVGLLDGEGLPDVDGLNLDPREHRDLARRAAEESVVLLANTGILPLAAPPETAVGRGGTLAVIGPVADVGAALLGGYSFVNHIECRYQVPIPPGIAVPTVLARMREEFRDWTILDAPGGTVKDTAETDMAAAAAVAAAADVAVVVVGDRSGIFGLGTVGEGSDVTSYALPGRQRDLVERVFDTGVPVVVVVVSGRPYALDFAVGRAAAILQVFFPGQEGASAVAGVLSGRIDPSGRLPLSMPVGAAAVPYTYRQSRYGRTHDFSEVLSEPLWPFGFGLSYTTFEYCDAEASASTIPTDGSVDLAITVVNTGRRAGTEVVQLYVHDPLASVSRPVAELVGFARVSLAQGGKSRVTFTVHADRLSFTGPDLTRIIEPGDALFTFGRSAQDAVTELAVTLTGDTRTVGSDRVLLTGVRVRPLSDRDVDGSGPGDDDTSAAADSLRPVGEVQHSGLSAPSAEEVRETHRPAAEFHRWLVAADGPPSDAKPLVDDPSAIPYPGP